MKVTKDQAAAFIDALTGYHGDDEDTAGNPNSPAALHHLQAVLGRGNLPWGGRIQSSYMNDEVRSQLEPFRDYLIAVVETITEHLGEK